MQSENHIPEPSQPEENLRDLLEAAEIRKSTELKRTAKYTNLVVGVPIGIFVLWAGVFLLTYTPSQVTPTKTSIPASLASQLSPEESEDPFPVRTPDGKDRVGKTNLLGLEESSGKLVDKDDIRFVMELSNFMNPPEHADKKQK